MSGYLLQFPSAERSEMSCTSLSKQLLAVRALKKLRGKVTLGLWLHMETEAVALWIILM